ncbi:MAG: DUF192 domain-containing protein [Negativicutes bacterium]|nr:DUF192 domain-containing protein [Negativicutes bacterium]
MRQVAIVNRNNTAILGNCVDVAETKAERLKGLLGTRCLPLGHGLLLRPCNGVHTYGMCYSIDVLFLDEEYRVVEIVPDMWPMRIARNCASTMVLELPAGTAAMTGTETGHTLMEFGPDQICP